MSISANVSLLRFEVADLLKLPSSLKSDERDELVYSWVKGAGCEERKHSNVAWANMNMKEWFVTKAMMEEMTASVSDKSTMRKETQLNQKQLADAAKGHVNIKVEFPLVLELDNLKKVLISADSVLNGQLKIARPLLSKMRVQNLDSGLQLAVDKVTSTMNECSDLIAMADVVEKSKDEDVIALTRKMTDMKELCSNVQDAMKLALKKAKAKLD